MATYQYRCADDGDVDVVLPIGTADPRRPCPECGSAMTRVFAPPHLNLASRRLVAAIDRTERTRDTPDVVSAPPARPRNPRPAPNPAHARLPRP